MPYYLDCVRIDTAIRRARRILTQESQKNGVYENFGQKEVRAIKNKFIDISSYTNEMNENRRKLKEFDNWCMNYNG